VDYVDYGRYLTQQRELRGLSRDDVSKATKIPPTLLIALETGEVDRLPGRVFVVNYIRAYAQVIGLEPDDAVLRFEEIDKTQMSTPPPAALERARVQNALRTLALVVLVLVVVGLGVLFYTGQLHAP
jgi:cytoskeletal protein RodZ